MPVFVFVPLCVEAPGIEDRMVESAIPSSVIHHSEEHITQHGSYRQELPKSQWYAPAVTAFESTPSDCEDLFPVIAFVPLGVETPVAVLLRGLPIELCEDHLVGVMLEQAGLEAAIIYFRVGDAMAGEVRVILSSWQSALHCIAHFNGCYWGGLQSDSVVAVLDQAAAADSARVAELSSPLVTTMSSPRDRAVPTTERQVNSRRKAWADLRDSESEFDDSNSSHEELESLIDAHPSG
jgi:hypothetical protein